MAETCDQWFLSCRRLYQHIIRKSSKSIEPMKYIPMCTRFHFQVGLSWSQFFRRRMPTYANLSGDALWFSPLQFVLSGLNHFQSGLWNSGSLIRVTQQLLGRFHCWGPAPCLLMMSMDWAFSQTRSLTLISIRCVGEPPLSFQIPMVCAAQWLSPIPVFLAQTWTCRVGIWIVLVSATTDFGNQKASSSILGSEPWWMMKWWISNASYSKHVSETLNISSMVT